MDSWSISGIVVSPKMDHESIPHWVANPAFTYM